MDKKVSSITEKRMEKMYQQYYSSGRVNLHKDTIYNHRKLKLVK